jgi:glycosyltransferase involved in cell wall biosynthesis
LAAASISVIVPALREASNLPALAERVHAALAPRAYELLIVDDNSPDDTRAVCDRLAATYPLRLIVRDVPKDGLSGAVLHGMAAATGDVLVVMDADLQHPPERLPQLIDPVLGGGYDFVLGSRYVAGGSIEEGWTLYRRINSVLATLLARPFAGKVADPMSGFFALRRADYTAAKRLTPLGYKIGLELLCKVRARSVCEVPIHFGRRAAGESKLGLREQFRYLEHLSRLYDFSYPRLSPMLKFAVVTLLSWLIAAACFTLLAASSAGASPGVVPAIAAAYAVVIGVTALFHARYVRTQREFLVRPSPWRDFAIAAGCEWTACVVTAIYLDARLRPTPLAGIAGAGGFVDRLLRLSETERPYEILLLSFFVALLARYALRKELLLDVRGLRHELRKEELTP